MQFKTPILLKQVHFSLSASRFPPLSASHFPFQPEVLPNAG